MAMASTRTPAHVIFNGRPGHYRAVPPSHTAPPTATEVCFRNLTGSVVTVWFPGNFLLGSPHVIENGETRCFQIDSATVAGTYPYAAQVAATGEFVEGNSPPDIIIDR
jgi:hypothetical protein